MKKLIYTAIIIAIQHSTLGIEDSFAQTINDNIGSGNCLDFDGNNDRIIVNRDLSWQSQDLTIEFWVNPAAVQLNTFSGIVGCHAEPYQGWVFQQAINDNNLFYLGYGNGTEWVCNSTPGNHVEVRLEGNTWQHIAITKSGVNISLYHNGFLEDSFVSSSSNIAYNSDTDLFIGDWYQSGRNFLGKIDEVRIWNAARTQSEIQDNMCKQLTGSETGLVGYWNMNEGTGGTITDLTVNGNDGTLQ